MAGAGGWSLSTGVGLPKKRVTLKLDADVLAWFRKMGRGYQWEINKALRRVIEKGRSELAAVNSREAAQECSPRRKPWGAKAKLDASPAEGERNVVCDI